MQARANPPGSAPDSPPRLFRGAHLPRCPTAWICRWEPQLQGQASCSVVPSCVEPAEAQACVCTHHLLVIQFKGGGRERMIVKKCNKEIRHNGGLGIKEVKEKWVRAGRRPQPRAQDSRELAELHSLFLLASSQAALRLVSNPSFLHLSDKMKWPLSSQIAEKIKTLY